MELSDYEKQRLANIARNQAELERLGLFKARKNDDNNNNNNKKRRTKFQQEEKKQIQKKRSRKLLDWERDDSQDEEGASSDDAGFKLERRRKQEWRKAKDVEVNTGENLRRSSRLRNPPVSKTPQIIKEEPDVPLETYAKEPGPIIKTEYDVQVLEKDGIRITNVTRDGGSSKDVFGRISDIENEWIGKILLPPEGSNSMKATVMYAIGMLRPKFSKYSGIQAFRNCVVLFVNATPAGQSGAKYNNMFETDSETNDWVMSWFAQTRQTVATPVIQRLLDNNERIYLFCRIPAQAYVCCGRLKLRQFYENNAPLRFDWTLTQSDQLHKSEAFQEILDFANETK